MTKGYPHRKRARSTKRSKTSHYVYGAETWAIKKAQERKLDVAEMKMLHWAHGVTRLDRIEIDVIREKLRVTEVHKKGQE